MRKKTKLKGINYSKYWKENCGMCKYQGIIKICETHLVKAPDDQTACDDFKLR